MNKAKRSKDNEELTLLEFNGTCFNCGKKGHKSTECKIKDSQGKFTGKCNTCGKLGHMARTCWENDENAHRRPKNWTSGKGSEVAAITERTGPLEKVLKLQQSRQLKFCLAQLMASLKKMIGVSCATRTCTRTSARTMMMQDMTSLARTKHSLMI
jgi:hypothetical protein